MYNFVYLRTAILTLPFSKNYNKITEPGIQYGRTFYLYLTGRPQRRHSYEFPHKKMIAPIIICCIIVLYYAGFICLCIWLPMPMPVKLILGLIPLLFIGMCLFVLIERIKEIRSGEEDDLSKY